jgi:2,5-diamino-6-(ribosylamino)-4(3H)-pyrimidinone 5'-phosphate reductase
LSKKFEDKLEKIQQIIAKLSEESTKGTPIVVEGKKDCQTLRELGVTGRILTVKTGGKSFLQAIAEIELFCASEVILLLDFDRRGKEGTALLKLNLERAKITVNTRFWRDLQALAGREIQSIESFSAYLLTLQEKTA